MIDLFSFYLFFNQIGKLMIKAVFGLGFLRNFIKYIFFLRKFTLMSGTGSVLSVVLLFMAFIMKALSNKPRAIARTKTRDKIPS